MADGFACEVGVQNARRRRRGSRASDLGNWGQKNAREGARWQRGGGRLRQLRCCRGREGRDGRG